MQRRKTLLLASTMAFAFGAITAATASAEFPEILPVPTATAPLQFEFTNGAGKIEFTKGKVLACEKGKGEGRFTTQDSGTVAARMEGCKEQASGAKCTSAGAETGTVIVAASGTDIEIVDYKEGTTLALATVITLLEMVKAKCGVISFEGLGAGMAKVTGVTSLVKSKTATLVSEQEKGMQRLTKCELPKAFCEGKTFMGETSLGSGHELTGTSGEASVTFAKEAEVHF